MLLQQILHQLDGELTRLQTMRRIVADLAKAPAIVKRLTPKIEQLLRIEKGREIKVEVQPAPVAVSPEQPRRRGRPRKNPLAAAPANIRLPRAPRHAARTRITEHSALSKAVSAGPVVVSAAALAQERETRATLKAAMAANSAPAPEVPPEMLARDLAARWLSSAAKD